MSAKGGAAAAAAVEKVTVSGHECVFIRVVVVVAVLNGSRRTKIRNGNISMRIQQNVGRMERIVSDVRRLVQMLYTLQQLQCHSSNDVFAGGHRVIVLTNNVGQEITTSHEFGNHVDFIIVEVFHRVHETQNIGMR